MYKVASAILACLAIGCGAHGEPGFPDSPDADVSDAFVTDVNIDGCVASCKDAFTTCAMQCVDATGQVQADCYGFCGNQRMMCEALC